MTLLKPLPLFFFFLLFFSDLFGKEGSGIVLMYHRFEDKKYPSTSISKENFYSQLLYLKKNNFNVLPVNRLIDFFYHNKSLPSKSIFITIDDAYKSFYNYAFPILKQFNYPFTIFLSTGFVHQSEESDFMDWKMLKEIKENKGSIYNHSHKHKSFIKQKLGWVEKDILLANQILKKKFGNSEKILSYPFGESNKSVQELIKQLGYKIAFSQHSSPISFDENKFSLPRFSINDEYGEMKRFKQVVNSKPLTFEFFEILEKNDKNSLEIKFKTNFDAKKINCFINDGILLKETNEEYTKIKLKKLNKDKRYRINCTIFKNKKLFWFGKMIIRDNEKYFY